MTTPNPAIVALSNRIATNTLTAGDQGALTTALAAIAPTFQGPDESSTVVFSDEPEAREWIAALYAIQAGNAAPMIALARVVTPTEITAWPVPFQPGVAGKILFVADITPEVSGELLASVNIQIISSAAGVPRILLGVVALTSVTGGTLIAPGITLEPTSITPAFGTAIPAATDVAATFDDGAGNTHTAILTLASVPINGVPGQRYGIVGFAADTSTQNWTALTGQISVVEQPIQ